jgi:hypothetical protein
MKTQGISFYFVLYIVAVITVFVITMERDQLLKERDEDIAHLVELYVRPLHLTPYLDTASFFIDPGQTVTQEPVLLRTKVEGPLEKGSVEFSFVRGWRTHGGTREELRTPATLSNENGDGVLSANQLTEGIYHFEVAGYSRRIMADGNQIRLKIKDTTYVIPYSPQLEDVDRDTVLLVAKITKSGIDPLQFAVSVQDREESWILGPPYSKKIFISGVEDAAKVTFTPPAGTRIERSSDGSAFVVLTWERPVLGKRSFRVTANANRGFGGKDLASVDFSVAVLPPSFVSEPSPKGFWGIPYSFDGRIQGLNPVDLAVSVLHNSQVVSSGPATQKLTFTPERNWTSIDYRITYRGHVIKEHPVTLTAPPPPQIKWLGQELDKAQNVFKINVTSSDAADGPVRLSVEAQPSGLARLDKISGKNFVVSINLESKPTAVFLKLVALDQYGGRSVSTKQFNIPQ